MAQIKRASKKELFGWAMFDFANSSYTTVIITVVFCIIFPRIIVGDGPEYRIGNLLWSVALSISYLVVLFSAPLFGAIMDYAGAKKKFLLGSYLLTVVATAALYFVSPGDIILGMLLIILSNTGFSYSEAFVSSFLPGLGPPEDLGKISGYAWGLGYFGGLLSAAIVIFGLQGSVYTVDNFHNLRLVGPVTGLFFLIAALPTFLWVKDRTVPRPLPANQNYFTTGWKRLKKTFRDLRDYRDLMILLASFFFAYSGLSIVIAFAFIYGDQIVKWSATTQILMFVITQFTAAGGALFFGFIQDKWKAKQTFILTLFIWLITVSLIYGINDVTALVNTWTGAFWRAEHIFLVIGSIAGLGLGSTQSLCRAMVGLFSPDTKSGEFFGLWSFTGRLSAIFGLTGLGFLQTVFGLQKAILICSFFFLISALIVFFVDEERGKRVALEHAGE
ncbi:MAG TPA: MFS transporter [Smithella sp.]|nr:MFS transporter [Smithella sp.]MDM7987000.1 MFS transporter [Smithella sp.]HNY50163.1 MFS transporter [Smithella sp.]HOG89520.1 MFS transporter [Smithella sp.]HQG64585.1 MFS transporter [Smithella sp.]